MKMVEITFLFDCRFSDFWDFLTFVDWFHRSWELSSKVSALKINWISKSFLKTFGLIMRIPFPPNILELAPWKLITLELESAPKPDSSKMATDRWCVTTRIISPMVLDKSVFPFFYYLFSKIFFFYFGQGKKKKKRQFSNFRAVF